MKKTLTSSLLFLLSGFSVFAQSIPVKPAAKKADLTKKVSKTLPANAVETKDIDNYWIAFDSIQSTKDISKQIDYINRLYIQKGTPGIAAFIKTRHYTDSLWVKNINKYPKFWASIRPATMKVKESAAELAKQVKRFKAVYPELKPATIYFTIGGLNTGGTVLDDKVLIGSEIVTGTPATDVSEFKDNWLKSVFANQIESNLVYLNLHEYVHTQQNGESENVLSQAIREGACDFIAELVMDKPISTNYLTYGRAHADSLRKAFKKEMFLNSYGNWFYNGGAAGEKADLGYYVGYEISKGYYQNAKNKKQAVKDLIGLNLSDESASEKILKGSGYFPEGFDKAALIADYERNQPYIVSIAPFANNAKDVDASVKEIRITFSKPMVNGRSFDLSSLGRDHFPLGKVIGFENDDRTIVMAVDLIPNKEYGFVVTNRGFKSKDGYVLKETNYKVVFKTK